MAARKKGKLWKTLLLIDQFFAVWLFNAHEDQTVSGYVGYKAYKGSQKYKRIERVINWLFSPWEDNHCYNAIEWDRIDNGNHNT